MSQLNIHMTPRFARALSRFMKARGIKTKSEAVRTAVEEALNRETAIAATNWSEMLGIANKGPLKPKDQWLTEDELWESNRH